jgi:hypothetical protein
VPSPGKSSHPSPSGKEIGKEAVKFLAIFDHAFLPPTGTLLSLRSLFNLGVSSPFSNSAISASLASVSKAAAHDL